MNRTTTADDYQLWSGLSRNITWTRYTTDRWKTIMKRRKTRTIIFVTSVSGVILYFGSKAFHKNSNSNTNSKGFTAHIPSCYGDDTCRLQDLRYDQQRIPDVFQKLNVRILGLDAPEIGARVKCDVEQCLAQHAKKT